MTSKAVPFVYLASVCRSLRCLIPALTQGGGGGLLFRLSCSEVLWEGGALQTSVPGLCGERSATLGLPPLRLHCSGSRLLCREQALGCVHFPGLSRSGPGSQELPKEADSVGPALCACPGRSSSGDQVLGQRPLPGWAMHPVTSQSQLGSFPGAVCQS